MKAFTILKPYYYPKYPYYPIAIYQPFPYKYPKNFYYPIAILHPKHTYYLNRVRINFSKLCCEKFLQNFTSFSFSQKYTMVSPEGQKMSKFACYRLLENKFFNVNYLVKGKNVFNPSNKNYLVETIVLRLLYVIYGSTTLVIANLICLANIPIPDLTIYHLE